MKNKYYTPTLEEFHVGFRYEEYMSLGTDEFGEEEFGWESLVFYGDFSRIAIELEDGKIRVKYLDQSDLEELGWEKSTPWVYSHTENYGLKHYRPRPDEPPLVTIFNSVGDKVFRGDVKNYNEMNRLMVMLNIANEK